MSLERRKPFAHLQPNAKSVEAAAAHPPISRPRRQMPAYHYHYQLQQNPHKRYATMLPGSSRSSATSSAESVYSITSGSIQPRRRKLSAAEDVAARVRARWAALEALERASASALASTQPTEALSGIATATSVIRTGARMDPRVPGQQLRYLVLAPPDRELGRENEKEKENVALSMQMQVDGHFSGEKPLPPRPAALGLHINPGSEPAHAPASAATTMVVPMAVDMHNNGDDATPRNDESVPTSDSTLRTTPTSLTCFEKESLRPVLQRRPTRARALTPPQVRRRPSITDELEEAVRSPHFLPFRTRIQRNLPSV